MKKTTGLLGTLVLLALTGNVSAVQWTEWNFKDNAFTSTTSGPCGGGASEPVCEGILTLAGGQTIKARAYSTPNGSTAANVVGSTLFRDAATGLGVQNSTSGDSHAVDDSGRFDLLVFEATGADADKFIWKELELGWVNSTGVTDIQAWVGNGGSGAGVGAGYDFTGLCLTGCSGNSIDGKFAALAGFSNVSANTDITLNAGSNAGKIGRYLVVSGALGSASNDAFKIKSVKGTPEPQTLALLGLGLIGMVAFVRRKAVFC